MTNAAWYVVSISKEDGHDINGKFMTNDFSTVREFAKAVNPLTVTNTEFSNEDECKELLNKLHESYELINPQDYIDT